MEENQIGVFIRDRRLELGMTQQQLADRLGITDKAVSKWERCLSYPDITLLRELADALGVSVTELLAGRRDHLPVPVPPEVEDVVLDTVCYAETARIKNCGWRFWLFVGLTAACLTAALVLTIIYFASNYTYGVLLAVKCVAFGWAVCYPLLRFERRQVCGSLGILTVAILPFLMQFPGEWNAWAAWIAVLSVAYLWAVYFVCRRFLRERPWLAAGLSLALGVPLSAAIHGILSSRGIDSSAFGIVITAITAGACFLTDLVLRHRTENREKYR